MKITRVDIKDWRILKSPQAEFGTSCAVIIGENGSGKSTLIELILSVFSLVFKRLKDAKATADFDGFYLEYQTSDREGVLHKVVLESGYFEGSKPLELHILIDGTPYVIKEDGGEQLQKLLPTNIITYYAGDTERVKNICDYFVRENVNAVIKSGNKYTLIPLELPKDAPFIYSDMRQMPIALMSLLVSREESKTIQKLNMREESVVFKFELKKPEWATAGSDKFWGNSSQLFNEFLKGLIEYGVRKESPEDKIVVEIAAMDMDDFLVANEIKHKGVFLFQICDLLFNNGLLDKVDVKWNRKEDELSAKPISTDYFSEGEKQVVMTSALVEFWDKKHCLFLFDEPDTFLHPKWQTIFLPEVQENLDESQAIITTHSALMVSSVSPDSELFVMENGRVIPCGRNTFGMDTNDINSLVMNTPPRNQEAERLVQSIRQDITSRHLEDAKRKLAELRQFNVSSLEINRLASTIDRIETIGR